MNRFFFVLVSVLPIQSALAQGTQADYERASSVHDRFVGKALNLAIAPTWGEGGNELWYSADRLGGKKEIVFVDAAAGTRKIVRESGLPKGVKPAPRRGSADRPTFPEPKPVSPDGKLEAYLRENNVWLRRGKAESQLSFDGNAGDTYDGQFFWSPDSQLLVAVKVQAGSDRRVTLVESSPRDQVQPKVIAQGYLKPGDAVAQPRPMLFDIGRHKAIPIRDDLFSNCWENERIRWEPDSSRFTFLHNARGHRVMRVIEVNRSGAAKAIINEECITFFDYSEKLYLRHLPDGRLLWMSERSGWNHLYLIDGKAGELLNPVTAGEWIVLGVDRVDLETKQIYLRIAGYHPDQDPYYAHQARVDFDGKHFTLLTEGDGTHDVQWSPNRKYFIDTFSRVDLAPHHVLRDADGKKILDLEIADISELEKAGWRQPERFALPGRDGKTLIHGYLLRPTNFDPSRKYPVIEEIYAGPHNISTQKRFTPAHYQQFMAELGFIIVKMDGMGTNWRSKAFHDVCWKNLQDAGFPDRIPIIKTLAAKHPEMDLSRGVGIFGGSAGGQNALGGLLHHGDFYTVGVADCGCHDNRMDKIWWNEAWMGWPVGPHYAAQSNVTNAHKLTGKLMLIVGEKDNNVDPASTMQVVDALERANKDFDLIVMTGTGHGAAETPYANRRRMDFFVRNLLGVEPRK